MIGPGTGKRRSVLLRLRLWGVTSASPFSPVRRLYLGPDHTGGGSNNLFLTLKRHGCH